MENLSGVYPVMFAGRETGRLNVKDDGMYVTFEMQSTIPTEEVLRLYCRWEDNFVPIGVAMPGGRTLRINKSFSRNELRKMRLNVITECVLSASLPEVSITFEKKDNETEALSQGVKSGNSMEEIQKFVPDEAAAENVTSEIESAEVTAKSSETQIAEDEVVTQDEVMAEDGTLPDADFFLMQEYSEAETAKERDKDGEYEAGYEENTDEQLVETSEKEKYREEYNAPDEEWEPPLTWRRVSGENHFFADHELDAASITLKDALVCTTDEVTFFAVPFSGDGSFPFMPVFCFGESGEIDGQEYLIFKIKNGNFI